jgi:hypothetical protein
MTGNTLTNGLSAGGHDKFNDFACPVRGGA